MNIERPKIEGGEGITANAIRDLMMQYATTTLPHKKFLAVIELLRFKSKASTLVWDKAMSDYRTTRSDRRKVANTYTSTSTMPGSANFGSE
jgi:hypothetical protein